MNLLKKIYNYFDNVSHEIKLIRLKPCAIFSLAFFLLGLASWFIGGSTNKVILFSIFPRSALPIAYAYVLWGISFAFCGFIFGGIVFGCEKFKRHHTFKICTFIIVMQIFVLCVYPVFFGAHSPFIAFVLLLLSAIFCIFSIIASYRIYSLWTVCLIFYLLWLIYNCYISLAFIFINW